VDRPQYYLDFAERVKALKASLRDLIASLKRNGKRVAAYGAAAKGSTLLNYTATGRIPWTSWWTGVRTSRVAACPAFVSRSTPCETRRSHARLRAPVDLEFCERNPGAAGGVPAARRQVHHSGAGTGRRSEATGTA